MSLNLLRRLAHDGRGTVTIETAIVAPTLVLMALGTFDAGSMVARQSELQSAAAEALAIVQASPPKDAAARETIRSVMETSANLTADQVSIAERFRCNTGPFMAANGCAEGEHVSTFIQVSLTDTYTPIWTQFGISSPMTYNVVRMVQVS